MKKLAILLMLFLFASFNASAIKVYAFILNVVKPGCFEVLVVITDDSSGDEYVISHGTALVGKSCGGIVVGNPRTDNFPIMIGDPKIKSEVERQTDVLAARMRRLHNVEIAPNPVQGKRVGLSFSYEDEGSLKVEVVNIATQKTYTTQITAIRGKNRHEIALPADMTGQNQLSIIQPNGDGVTSNIIVE